MTDSLKIAVSARDVVGSGGGTVAIETVRHFSESSVDVKFVVDTAVPFELAGAAVVKTAYGQRLKEWLPSSKPLMRLRHFLQMLVFSVLGRLALRGFERSGYVTIDHNLETFGADIVVVHNVFLAQYKADRRSWSKKIPQFFNPVFAFRILREQIVFRSNRVKAVIAVSEQTLNEARPYLRADALQFVIHNGINLSRYHPLDDATRTANRQALGVAERFVMLFVGHEFERKRLDLVLEALAALPPTVCLWVIGGRSSSSTQYANLARRLGVAERVQFLGTVNDAERYYQAADVFVLPSDYETWGLVVMEAMACGTPVLMTPVGCAPHVVRDGETGYLVDYHAQSIVEKVSVLLSDGARYAAMRRAARLAAEPYDWSGVARKYLDVVAAVRERMHGA